MAVMRIHKTGNFTIISNTHLRDKKLSLKAKGLLTLMLSLPDNWDYSVNGLAYICKEGKVDTLDLYALLYMTDEEEESGIDPDHVQKAEQAAKDWKNSQNGIDNITETEENLDSESETPEVQPNSGMNNMMMLGIGAFALIAAGIVAFLMMKKKPVQKSEPELNYDDSDEDDDF